MAVPSSFSLKKRQDAPVDEAGTICYTADEKSSVEWIEHYGESLMKHTRIPALLLALLLLLAPLSVCAKGPEDEAREELPADVLLWTRETAVSADLRFTESVFDNGSRQAEHYITYAPGGTALPRLGLGGYLREKLEIGEAEERQSDAARVLAGANGDYFVMATGMPLGIVIREGELLASDAANEAVGFYEDGTAIIGSPALTMRFSVENESYRISGLNKAYAGGQFCLYTPAWGENTPARGVTWNIVLIPETEKVLQVGQSMTYTVESVYRSDGATPITEGRHILCLSAESDDWRLYGVEHIERGGELTVTFEAGDERFANCVTALGSLYRLAENGAVAEGLDKIDKNKAPRTAIGIREDGTVLLYTVDGRQNGYSLGLTLEQTARRLLELGCTDAGVMDGGGSTVLAVQLPGEEGCSVRNLPSLGYVREVPEYLFFAAPLSEPGQPETISVYCEEAVLLAGSSSVFSCGCCDGSGFPLPSGDIRWSADRGEIDRDGRYTAPEEAGDVTITAALGSVSGSLTIPVIREPDSLTICLQDGENIGSLQLLPGEEAELSAAAMWHTMPVCAEDGDFEWSLEGACGLLSETGTFAAFDEPGAGTIRVSAGGCTAELPVLITDRVVCAEDFENGEAGSAPGLAWQTEHMRDYVKYGGGSLRLDYDLAEGSVTYPLEEQPTGLFDYADFWLLSDGSGNNLYSVHEGITILLGSMEHNGWMQFTVDTRRYGPILGLRIGGSGSGTVYLDQLILTSEAAPDTEPPVLQMERTEEGLTAQIWDRAEGFLPASMLRLTADGEPLSFDYAEESGILTAKLPETDGSIHCLLTAYDRSGNYNTASLLIESGRETPFTDLGGCWAAPYAAYLNEHGVAAGKPADDGTLYYDPDTALTRAEFAVLLCRWLGIDTADAGDGNARFLDESAIPGWAADSVAAAVEHGLIQGSLTDEGVCFLPKEPITRAQAAVILGRTMEGGRMGADLPFDDAAEISRWAQPYVAEFAFMGIMNGEANRFDPSGSLTRAEAAYLLTELT